MWDHEHVPGVYLGIQRFAGRPDLHIARCAICETTMTVEAPKQLPARVAEHSEVQRAA